MRRLGSTSTPASTHCAPEYESPFDSAERHYAEFRPGYGDATIGHLRDRFSLDDAARVLDLGCGAGQLTVPLAAGADEVVAMDPTATMLAEVKQGEIPLRREWSVDAVVGYVFSLSCCSPATFGEERAAFEVALRERLVELGGGPFTQETVVEIISGRVDGP